jgi:nuclease S1
MRQDGPFSVRRRTAFVLAMAMVLATFARLDAWSAQGHRLVALVAASHLTDTARRNVAWLLGGATLADVAVWADQYVSDHRQTGPWHYVNIPPGATRYDRNRDCPRQPRVVRGAVADGWRDCAVDRILYNEERLANRSLSRADRAMALKFLVHLVGDLHQPFHAFSLARGGNDIPIVAFGSPACAYPDGTRYGCNLHGIWDSTLIERRGLRDRPYLDELSREIRRHHWDEWALGTVADWAMESHDLAAKAVVPPRGKVDDAYYQAHIGQVNERLALGGLRLAALLNQILSVPPPR